jgi:hypothetical protein
LETVEQPTVLHNGSGDNCRRFIASLLEVLPEKAEHALTSGDQFDKLKEQDIMRTSAQTALETLINEEDVVRTDAGKRGDQYRHYRPEEDSAETTSVSGREILDKDEAGGFLSAETSTYRDGRKRTNDLTSVRS